MPVWYSNGTVKTRSALSKDPMQHSAKDKKAAICNYTDSGFLLGKITTASMLPTVH